METLRTTVQQIDLIRLIVKQHPKVLDLVVRSEDILKSFHSGKIAGLIGIEGLHQIADSVSVLRMYHGLGVRYITLCHNASNAYADSAVS